MWHSPKKLLAAGALVVLTGGHSYAQDPSGGAQDNAPVLPAPSAVGDSTPGAPSLDGQAGPSVLHVQRPPVIAGAASYPMPAQPVSDERNLRAKAHPPCLEHRDVPHVPLGTFVYRHFQTQVNNGIAAHMVLHDYDFICGGDKLNLRGRDELRYISQFWRANNYPLVIERTPYNPGLAEKRRAGVLQQLAELGIGVPAELVVIGAPTANPLRGFEAELIYQNLYLQTLNRGSLPGQGIISSGAAALQQGVAPGLPSGTGTAGMGTIGTGASGVSPSR
jgi:hypothetical protein